MLRIVLNLTCPPSILQVLWPLGSAKTHSQRLKEDHEMPAVEQVVHCKTKKPLELKGSVAIVGNSDQILDKDCGREIDSHDNVFRFNLAALDQQYQKAIGSKSDFFLLSRMITTVRYPHPEPLQSRFIQICRNSKIICYPGHTKNVMRYCKRPYLLANDISIINQTIIRLFGHPPAQFSVMNHPRNGVKLAVALMIAGIKPTLFGFDLEARDAPSHYFDDELQIEAAPGTSGHRPSLEYALLRACLDKGLIDSRN